MLADPIKANLSSTMINLLWIKLLGPFDIELYVQCKIVCKDAPLGSPNSPSNAGNKGIKMYTRKVSRLLKEGYDAKSGYCISSFIEMDDSSNKLLPQYGSSKPTMSLKMKLT
uniref:Uncharacterized protein n=1 Tax=Romanomermis culicivorax TaxID=13658 RepID=A0A915JJT6_ROMCU